MVNPIHNIEGLISELLHNEKKERHDLARLIIFSKKLKVELVKDSDNIFSRKKFVDEIVRGKRSRVDLNSLRIVHPDKSLVFCKKDVALVEKVVGLTRRDISGEEKIRNEVKVLFSRISSDSKLVLNKIFKHVSGEEILDRKELELELKSVTIFHLVLDLVEKKFGALKSEGVLLKSGALKDLRNQIINEENINKRLIGLLDEVISIENTEKKIEGEKKGLLKSIVKSNSTRNILILAVLIIVAAPFLFKSFSPSAQDVSDSTFSELRSLYPGSIIFSDKDIVLAKNKVLDVNAKTDFLNGLMQLYYYAKDKCGVNTCFLESSAINSLLSNDKKLKGVALSATEISLSGHILKIVSAKPLSAVAPGSLNTATIYLDNTEWGVSESDGNFEFNLLSGKAWLKVNSFGKIGSFFLKGGDEKIVEIDDIKRALLFKYTRNDGSTGLYGILYDSSGKVKDGIDLASEDFSSVNQIPKADEARAALAFSSK
jgi:hypothetical protein